MEIIKRGTWTYDQKQWFLANEFCVQTQLATREGTTDGTIIMAMRKPEESCIDLVRVQGEKIIDLKRYDINSVPREWELRN